MSSSSGRDAMYANARSQRSSFDLELDLLDLVGVDADGVAARAEAAVDRAGVERQEQRLVGVAVREPGDRRVGLLVQRVEVELRVIGQEARRERDELACAADPRTGCAQSMSDSRYGETRTLIGARSKPARRVLDELRRRPGPGAPRGACATFVIEFFACHLWSRNSASLTLAYAGILCQNGPRRSCLWTSVASSTAASPPPLFFRRQRR